MLFSGKPGLGKTETARAISNEYNYNFISVTPSDILGQLIGQSEKNLRCIFNKAKANQPSIIFIDELEKIFPNNLSLRNSYSQSLIAEFNNLTEGPNGIMNNNYNIMLIGATNNEKIIIDSVFRRFGGKTNLVIFEEPKRNEKISFLLKDLKLNSSSDDDDKLKNCNKLKKFKNYSELKDLKVNFKRYCFSNNIKINKENLEEYLGELN